LHFSHIGLTDGRTFTLVSLSSWTTFQWYLGVALETASDRRYLAEEHTQRKTEALQAHTEILAGVGSQAAARPPVASCHGVRTLGPSGVIAIVNSKWAARDPSWE
jgi:hypothetical protein